MNIDIFSDTICPWCLIGKRRLERALVQRPALGATVRWHAFQLNPGMPAEGMDRAAYLAAKFGQKDAASVYENIRRIGAEEAIEFRFDLIQRTPNTLLSHRLIRRAGEFGRQTDIVEGLFSASFREGRAVGSREVLDRQSGGSG